MFAKLTPHPCLVNAICSGSATYQLPRYIALARNRLLRHMAKVVLSSAQFCTARFANEILVDILQYVGWRDILACRQTCKRLSEYRLHAALDDLFQRLSAELVAPPILERPIDTYEGGELEILYCDASHLRRRLHPAFGGWEMALIDLATTGFLNALSISGKVPVILSKVGLWKPMWFQTNHN
ncbi:hypothetical protein BJ912DRAFT_1044933 [Pholiota molesta]|nr:hypothetical protein BJ912DRAFT_1044933 [Pholiota molesta]